MSLFKNLFNKGKNTVPNHTNFQEGDIFYTQKKGKYQFYKLLKIEQKQATFHVKSYEPITQLPTPNDIPKLKVTIHHFPVAKTGFENPKFFINIGVHDVDLMGYFEYIKQTGDTNEIVKYSKQFYQEAHELSNQKNHASAIKKYTQTIDLIPGFFEAIDNRSFCYMDLAQWKDAIRGFEHSLKVKPESILATFSIGECYFRLKEYQKAKTFFEKALEMNPSEKKAQEYLEMTIKLIKNR